MTAEVVDLARKRAASKEPRIAIYPRGRGVEVALEPPSHRPGVVGKTFVKMAPARRYAQAMAILDPRPITVVWGILDPGAAK